MTVKVKFDVYGDEEFEGKVSLVYPTIDATTHTFPVEVKLANTHQRIRPGMFGRVTVSFGTLRHVVVPDQAIVKRAVRAIVMYMSTKTVRFPIIK